MDLPSPWIFHVKRLTWFLSFYYEGGQWWRVESYATSAKTDLIRGSASKGRR